MPSIFYNLEFPYKERILKIYDAREINISPVTQQSRYVEYFFFLNETSHKNYVCVVSSRYKVSNLIRIIQSYAILQESAIFLFLRSYSTTIAV